MRLIGKLFGMCCGLMLLAACSQKEEWGSGSLPSDMVSADLSFSVTDGTIGLRTRMDDAVVQADGSFRGMTVEHIIPFATTSSITTSDQPVDFILGEQTTPKERFYYYPDCMFLEGTASMLVYGKAKTGEGSTKVSNGSLVPNFPVNLHPSGITFQLEQMYTDAEHAPTEASQIADYMTTIAKNTGWAESNDGTLKNYYEQFIGKSEEGYSILAGSSASVAAYVEQLKEKITALPESEIRTAILNYIDQSYPTDYPGNLHLPDGAATLQWDASQGKFVALTQSTATAPINSLTHFAYPPELWYYANSRIRTSTEEVGETVYESATDWTTLRNAHYSDDAAVSYNTQAVAITDMLQYAVARLKIVLDAMPTSLNDATEPEPQSITADSDKFPLTGIIVGGQRSLGFDFTPKEPLTDEDVRFIYDSRVPASGTINTLVLQTYDNEIVRFALEFENNSGVAFQGAGGVILPGTKFYLIGSVDPSTQDSSIDYNKRVFTRDCITELRMQVVSLKKAYNVMPNLLSPRLELGVVVYDSWHVTESEHEIYNW